MKSEACQLLKRLFEEQCEVIEAKGSGDSDKEDGDGDGDKPAVSSSEPEASSSETDVTEAEAEAPSAHDPDALYGHKGRGYNVHVSETCNNPDTPEIITD